MKRYFFSVGSFTKAAFFILSALVIVTGSAMNAPAKAEVSAACQAKNLWSAGTIISTHGPVEVHVYNVPGESVGPLADGKIELGINGVSYKQTKDNVSVFVPAAGGPYAVDIQAFSTGSFDLRVSIVAADKNIVKVIGYKDIAISGESQIVFTLDSAVGDSTVLVDEFGTAEYSPLSPTWVNSWPAPVKNKSRRCF